MVEPRAIYKGVSSDGRPGASNLLGAPVRSKTQSQPNPVGGPKSVRHRGGDGKFAEKAIEPRLTTTVSGSTVEDRIARLERMAVGLERFTEATQVLIDWLKKT